jgi:hypothetical protein
MNVAQGPHGPRDGNPTHLTFFRYGEVTVVFERTPTAVAADLIEVEQARIVDAFQQAGVKLSQRYHPLLRRRAAHDNDLRQGVPFERTRQDGNTTSRVAYYLQTFNLEHWDPRLEVLNAGNLNGHSDALDDAIRDVPSAVQSLINGIARNEPLTIDGFRAVAASPNWLAMPFCWVNDGHPGGRPVKGELKSFRPGDVPTPVHDAVARCLTTAASQDVPGHMRVAILDTWPMDREPAIECGKNPRYPLDKIGRFARDGTNRPGTGGNARLQKAADGDLVHADRIFDYVSCEPEPVIPATHYNWDTRQYEPGYDLSSHGLFIADMIKDIAPQAELYVYRVLNDAGTSDLHTVARALEDAVREAGTENVVINMSLGFAPQLLTIKDLLKVDDDGVVRNAIDLQDTKAWATELANKSRSDGNYGSNPNIDAQLLEADGLAQLDGSGKVLRLLGPLAGADYFFRVRDKHNVLVVAAAGNDSNGVDCRFGPRLPAYVEGILGVAAKDASYSNRDDIEQWQDDGVSAFGGEAENDPSDGIRYTADGIYGLSINDYLPPPGGGPLQTNVDGWALWAGTSFAAPIAAALAACVWTEPEFMGRTGAEVMNAIVNPPNLGPFRVIDLNQA